MSHGPPEPHDREVELVLELGDGDAERVLRHPLLRRLGRGRTLTRGLRSVYFDTPELGLRARGLALRLRDGPRGSVQAVKSFGESRAGLFERAECEAAVPAAQPDPTAVSDPVLRAALLAETLHRGHALHPVLETEVRRSRRLLVAGGSEIELSLDVGELRTRAGAEPIRELELELLRGEPAALFDVALALQADLPLRPAALSKAERGFLLLSGLTPAPRRARPLDLGPESTLDAVLEAVVGEALAQIAANQPAADAGQDPEGVHQLRVGVRRLRSALALFRKLLPEEPAASLRQELRWLGGETGPARDLDVFLAERLGPILRHRRDDGALKRLRDEALAARAEAYDRVRAALRSSRAARLLLSLGRWHAARAWRDQPLNETSARLFAPALDAARPLLARRHRKALALGRDLQGRSVAELHALRIQMKKLRYAAEFLRSLFPPKRADRFIRRTARLQDVLGHLNDVAMAEALLAGLLDRLGAEAGGDVRRAAGFVTGWSAHVASQALDQLDRRWQRFADTSVFWD